MRNSRANGAAHTHVFRLRNFLRTMSIRVSEGLKENATVTPALVCLVSKKSQERTFFCQFFFPCWTTQGEK